MAGAVARRTGAPTFFFNLSVSEGGKPAFTGKVPVSQAELTVMATVAQSLIPRMLGFDRSSAASEAPQAAVDAPY